MMPSIFKILPALVAGILSLLPGYAQTLPPLTSLPDTAFVRLADYSKDFSYDLRYATTNNFVGEQVYDCAECYTRVATAKALIQANNTFLKKGYRIRFFDCYRPLDVQRKLWKIVPNPTYVADPAKGSIHNRGGAVDITLETLNGQMLDMGTDFDHFGPESRHANQNFPDRVLANRRLLKETMESFGFRSITSEWWHYNYAPTVGFSLANFAWDCSTKGVAPE